MGERLFRIRNPGGAELGPSSREDVCKLIAEGHVMLDAIAAEGDTATYLPITQYAPFAKAFEERFGIGAALGGSEATPISAAASAPVEGSFRVMPVPDALLNDEEESTGESDRPTPVHLDAISDPTLDPPTPHDTKPSITSPPADEATLDEAANVRFLDEASDRTPVTHDSPKIDDAWTGQAHSAAREWDGDPDLDGPTDHGTRRANGKRADPGDRGDRGDPGDHGERTPITLSGLDPPSSPGSDPDRDAMVLGGVSELVYDPRADRVHADPATRQASERRNSSFDPTPLKPLAPPAPPPSPAPQAPVQQKPKPVAGAGTGFTSPHAAAESRLKLLLALAFSGILFGLLFATGVLTRFGAGEASYSPASAFFYVRVALLVFAGLGMSFMFLDRAPISPGSFAIKPEWSALAIAAGLGGGALAPSVRVGSPLFVALAMSFLATFAEEIYFRGYLDRTLKEAIRGMAVPAIASGLLFGVYQLTYTSLWVGRGTGEVVALAFAIALVSGVPYSLIRHASKSFVPPFLCHLASNVVMIVLSSM